MKLPSFLGKKENKEYFLALLLRDEKVTAVIFEELSGKIRVIGHHDEYFTDSIETTTVDEWLEVLDKAISQAETALPENIETQKTIFGVKENWVEDTKLKKEYLLKIKKASDALGLFPIGFLVMHEAIAHLMQKEEGAPVSAILIEVGKTHLAVSLLRAGRIIETKRTKIEDAIPKITDRILHHFTSYEVLPSRIVIVGDTDNTEELSQQFIGHSWSKSLPFLHVPQITIQPKDFDGRAVLFGAATQMGFDVLEENEEKRHEDHKEQVEDKEEENEEDFGFVKEKDVASIHNKKQEEKSQEQELNNTTAFIETEKYTNIFLTMLATIKQTVSPLPSFPSFSPQKKLVFIPPFVVVCLLLILLAYIFGLKATVTLIVAPKVIEKNQDITFSTENSTDTAKKTVAAQIIEAVEEGKISVPATGKKEIGEKAKGTVTIYSNLTREQTFTKGSLITVTNKLVFVLDETVKVASVSGASDGQKTVKASVVAKDIGKESNIPSGVKFTVSSFDASEVEAKNDTAFSGGTKKEVTVIAKADAEKAISDLSKNLEKKAKDDLSKNLSQEQILLPILVTVSFTKKDFDKNIDDEASSTTLTATISYKGLSYKKGDLVGLSKNLLQEDIGDGTFSKEDITYDLKDIKMVKNEVKVTLFAKASLLPKFDNQKMANVIVGKTFEQAKSILTKINQVTDVHIILQPTLPFLPNLLPRNEKNISFVIKKG